MPEPPKEIRLVHGEEKVRRALAMALGIEGHDRSQEFTHQLGSLTPVPRLKVSK